MKNSNSIFDFPFQQQTTTQQQKISNLKFRIHL
jgi:hypothetical protein